MEYHPDHTRHDESLPTEERTSYDVFAAEVEGGRALIEMALAVE